MNRRDAHLDALVRELGAAYYQALHGHGSAAEVGRAVARVSEAESQRDLGAPPDTERAPVSARRSGRWQVSDVMTTKVVSVARDTSYRQVAELLREHHLTAVPVVTPDQRVIGVVSEADLLRKQERHEHAATKPGWTMHRTARTKAEARTAEGLMTTPAITIGPEALLGTAARAMNAHHVNRLPVVAADGTMVGVVSRADLLRVFLRPDEEIAAEAADVLTDILLADPATVRVTARHGVVTLTGRVERQEQIATAIRLIESVDGVVSVICKLHAPPPEDWPGAGYHIPA
jgi:CBS domain-containing protein